MDKKEKIKENKVDIIVLLFLILLGWGFHTYIENTDQYKKYKEEIELNRNLLNTYELAVRYDNSLKQEFENIRYRNSY